MVHISNYETTVRFRKSFGLLRKPELYSAAVQTSQHAAVSPSHRSDFDFGLQV